MCFLYPVFSSAYVVLVFNMMLDIPLAYSLPTFPQYMSLKAIWTVTYILFVVLCIMGFEAFVMNVCDAFFWNRPFKSVAGIQHFGDCLCCHHGGSYKTEHGCTFCLYPYTTLLPVPTEITETAVGQVRQFCPNMGCLEKQWARGLTIHVLYPLHPAVLFVFMIFTCFKQVIACCSRTSRINFYTVYNTWSTVCFRTREDHQKS